MNKCTPKHLCVQNRAIRAASLEREVTRTLLQHEQYSDTSSDTYLHAKEHARKVTGIQVKNYLFFSFCPQTQQRNATRIPTLKFTAALKLLGARFHESCTRASQVIPSD